VSDPDYEQAVDAAYRSGFLDASLLWAIIGAVMILIFIILFSPRVTAQEAVTEEEYQQALQWCDDHQACSEIIQIIVTEEPDPPPPPCVKVTAGGRICIVAPPVPVALEPM
jgi:hypothetical protein